MNYKKPSSWCLWALRKFAHPDTLEEAEGDLLEFHRIWTRDKGTAYANRRFFFTVLTLVRPFAVSKKKQRHNSFFAIHIMMIESYFKMTWRALKKNSVSTIINISGLTLGLAIGILVLLVVMNEFSYNNFQRNLPDLYLLMKNQETNTGIYTGESTAGPIAEALNSGFPEVKLASRMAGFSGQQVVADKKISYESGIYVDPSFFQMMSFPGISGDPAAAVANNSLVLTRDMAQKMFGTVNAVGKSILFDRHHSLSIGAIIENIPSNSTIKFNMAVPFAIYRSGNPWLEKWDDNRIETWVQLNRNADVAQFNKKITEMLQQQSNDQTESLFAYPMSVLHLYGNFSNGQPSGGKITLVWTVSAFGIFMLLIACINFMNISTAQSEHRSREVGVRKVLGASRKSIVLQFLNESFVVTFFSLAMAVLLAYSILPGFNTLTHSNLRFDLVTPKEWVLIAGIGMITALVAGSYPSLFLSRFLPARVLKGATVTSRGGMRKSLVTFQFVISVFFLIGTIIMYAQFNYVQNRPLGYEQANLIDVRLDSLLSAKFNYLESEILKLPGVVDATGGSDNILQPAGSVTGMDWTGKQAGDELSVVVTDVGYHWTRTMQMNVLKGRDFDPAYGNDISTCLINESAAHAMGLTDPVSSMVGGHQVIGVVEDFVYNNPFGSIGPMAVFLNPNHMNHLYIRIRNNENWRQTIDQVEKLTNGVSPEFPFSFSFTRDEYQDHFEELNDTGLIVSIFGGITLFISCLGLFGLSGFVAEKRSKEMSIRKVFGATIRRVLVALSSDFLKPVRYALLFVVPVSVVCANWALSNFNYRVALQWWMFASGGIIILIIAFLIVMYHGLRTAFENPATRLRNE